MATSLILWSVFFLPEVLMDSTSVALYITSMDSPIHTLVAETTTNPGAELY